MLAGIIGDTIGSVYEAHQWQRRELDIIQPLPVDTALIKPLFSNLKWVRKDYSWTDDTLCTLALYSAYIHDTNPVDTMVYFCRKYGHETIGFGKAFNQWIETPEPYGSFGNGAIMRLGFMPFLDISLSERLRLGYYYTSMSHNHPDSYQAVYDFITMTYQMMIEQNKDALNFITTKYDFNKTVQSMHDENIFEMNALQTLLQACVIVQESNTLEEVLINSFYVGGDSDTIACIAANIASVIMPTPKTLLDFALDKLEDYHDLDDLVTHFLLNNWGRTLY